MKKDEMILRGLAERYAEICSDPDQDVRRDLWRRHNSLERTRPLIYVRAFAWSEMEESVCSCRDPFLRRYEDFFRNRLFWNTFGDDSIFEPWVTVEAVKICTGWGVKVDKRYSNEPRGSFKVDYPLRNPEDIEKLRFPRHGIDEKATAARAERLQDVIGDIITIDVDRGPAYRMWSGDLSTDLGYLRGIENFMLDMSDNPKWLHRLVAFMSDGVLASHDQAEEAGDWGLSAHQNQAMPYAKELVDPRPNTIGVGRGDLWGYMAAQEFTGVSPAMHEEFLLRYQLPILSKFGLSAYGCCEDLTEKIDMLRRIPNLRRIAVSPFADVRRCAEQIGTDYVLSYRPSPTDMVGYGFDENRIRGILKDDFAACGECHFDVTLKDVETVQDDPRRIGRWVEITRQEIDRAFG